MSTLILRFLLAIAALAFRILFTAKWLNQCVADNRFSWKMLRIVSFPSSGWLLVFNKHYRNHTSRVRTKQKQLLLFIFIILLFQSAEHCGPSPQKAIKTATTATRGHKCPKWQKNKENNESISFKILFGRCSCIKSVAYVVVVEPDAGRFLMDSIFSRVSPTKRFLRH